MVHALLGLAINERLQEALPLAGAALSVLASFWILHKQVTAFQEGLLPPILFLYCTGWIEIWRLRPAEANKQSLWLLVATLAAVVFTRSLKRISHLERYRIPMLVGGLALLCSAWIFGAEINGAKLWLRFGPLSFQPIEIVKILMVISLASFWRRFRLWMRFTTPQRDGRLPRRGMAVLMLGWFMGLAVLVAQRDLGMALLLIGVLFTTFYVALGKKKFVVLGVGAFFVASAVAIVTFHHVRIRVRAWWDPFVFFDTDGYQMVQGLYAVADGGPWGRGLFLGRPYLVPEAHNDFILIAQSHELGWLTALAVIACSAFLGHKFFVRSTECGGQFRRLLMAGLASLWSLQCFIIIAGTTKVIPMTGLTLPFVSYGGSSLLANMLLVALVAKCGRYGT